MRATRKRIRVLMLAAVVAAAAVPVGFALSLEPTAAAPVSAAAPVMAAYHPDLARPAISSFHDVPDAAKLFGLGTLLMGLAAAVRRAV